MSIFSVLFGIEQSQVQEHVILAPMVPEQLLCLLDVSPWKKGRLYSCAQGQDFTLIKTMVGAWSVGDAVLHLSQTPCRDILLWGSCGSLGRLALGELVCPQKAFELESFSRMLSDPRTGESFEPDPEFNSRLLGSGVSGQIKAVSVLTVGSLQLEEPNAAVFRSQGIDVLDMECSAFFAAAHHIRKPAAALFFVSDIVGEKPFYAPRSEAEQAGLIACLKLSAGIIKTVLYGN